MSEAHTPFSFPMEIPASAKTAATSSSTLILLLLLRCNRFIVPYLLNYLTFRHKKWVTRVPIDVGIELRKDPNQRRLCAGPCCGESYGTFSAARSTSQLDPDYLQAAQERPAPPSVQNWARAVYKAYAPTKLSRDASGDPADADDSLSTEGEIYLQLRIQQEKRHRSQRKEKFMVPKWLFQYFTIISLLTYSAIIVYIVVHLFQFDAEELFIYSFSLMMSGAVSEWDVLWPSKYGPPVWMERHSSSDADTVATSDAKWDTSQHSMSALNGENV